MSSGRDRFLFTRSMQFIKQEEKLKMKIRRLLSVLLAVVMLLAISAPTYAATVGNVKKYSNMLVLGDSIVCADELPTVRDFAPVVDSYSYDLAHMLGLETYNSLAFRAASSLDELYVLGAAPDNYMSLGSVDYVKKMCGDAFMANVTNVAQGKDNLVGNPRDRVKEADLIIIQLGNNDVAGHVFRMMDLDLYALLDGRESFAKRSVELISRLNTAMKQYKTYYPALIREIKSLNGRADIVLVGNYNPYAQVSFFEGNEDIAVGNLLSTTTKDMNSQVKSWAKKYGCIYVDTFALSEEFPPQSFQTGLSFSPMHPTAEGHRWIAEQILKALPATEKELSRPAKGSARFAFGIRDAGVYKLSREGLFWNITDPATGKYLSVGAGAKLKQTDSSDIWCYNGGFYRFGTVSINSNFGFTYLKFSKIYLTSDGNGGLTTTTSKSSVTLFSID